MEFLDSKSNLEDCFCPIQGSSDDSASGLTSVLEDLWQQFRSRRFFFFFAFGVFAEITLQSVSPFNLCPVSCDSFKVLSCRVYFPLFYYITHLLSLAL